MTVGWYVHHHGRGHANRAAAIRPHVRDRVTVLSSLPPPRTAGSGADNGCTTYQAPQPAGSQGWVLLPRDGDDRRRAVDPTAHHRLHWVPTGDPGLRDRMGVVAAWITEHRPTVMVVDVSVEVALLARLFGVPVIVVAGPGDRRDAPHRLAYDIAERIIAPWPQEVYDPPYLHPYAAKTVYVGAISRFDGSAAPAGSDVGGCYGSAATAEAADAQVVILSGGGGSAVTEADVAQARAAVPGRRWRSVGVTAGTWTDDVWAQLSTAGVIVTHGGQNSLAEVAAARRPAIVVPQQRPFGEQLDVAAALARHRIALRSPTWPAADEWPGLVDQALQLGGQRWSRWSSGHGAADAAAVIDAVGGPR